MDTFEIQTSQYDCGVSATDKAALTPEQVRLKWYLQLINAGLYRGEPSDFIPKKLFGWYKPWTWFGT